MLIDDGLAQFVARNRLVHQQAIARHHAEDSWKQPQDLN
jgi:hypothetical protein